MLTDSEWRAWKFGVVSGMLATLCVVGVYHTLVSDPARAVVCDFACAQYEPLGPQPILTRRVDPVAEHISTGVDYLRCDQFFQPALTEARRRRLLTLARVRFTGCVLKQLDLIQSADGTYNDR